MLLPTDTRLGELWPDIWQATGETLLMVALTMLLYQVPWLGLPVFTIGEWLLAGAALLTLWSGFEYLRAAWPSGCAQTVSR